MDRCKQRARSLSAFDFRPYHRLQNLLDDCEQFGLVFPIPVRDHRLFRKAMLEDRAPLVGAVDGETEIGHCERFEALHQQRPRIFRAQQSVTQIVKRASVGCDNDSVEVAVEIVDRADRAARALRNLAGLKTG